VDGPLSGVMTVKSIVVITMSKGQTNLEGNGDGVLGVRHRAGCYRCGKVMYVTVKQGRIEDKRYSQGKMYCFDHIPKRMGEI